MKKNWVFIGIAVLIIIGMFGYAYFPKKEQPVGITPQPIQNEDEKKPEAWLCNGDGKICPDGSLVGRTGPNCEFTACPLPTATTSIQTTYMGGTVTGLNVSVNPKELVSDSRCPSDVQCVWAGTVEVRTVIFSKVAHGEHVLTLGKPQTFGDYTVTLTKVTPEKNSTYTAPISSYRFTFEIKKK